MTLGHVTAEGTGQAISWLGGSVHRVLLDAEATEGRLALFRSVLRGGGASPVHVHDREDETVHLLSGTALVWAGDRRWELGPGDTAFLPRGLPHTYLVTSTEAELITVCNPAGFEEFLRAGGWDLAEPLPDGWQVDMQLLADAGRANGQHVLGPPLAPGDDMPPAYL